MNKPEIPRVQTIVLAAAVAGCSLWARSTFGVQGGRSIGPEGFGVVPFAAVFGLGCAILVMLGWHNRHRWRRVYRPNRGRVIGALILGFVTPFAVMSWGPWILGGLLIVGAAELETGLAGAALLATCIAATCWYPASCLIVSGISRKWVRVCLFSLMYLSAYSAIILMFGNQRFGL